MNDDFGEIFNNWEKNNKIIDKDKKIFENSKKLYNIESNKILHEIDLHGLNRNEALRELENFILLKQNYVKQKIKIIHGSGRHSKDKSILKDIVADWLKKNIKLIESFRQGKIGEGNYGVTIATIKKKK